MAGKCYTLDGELPLKGAWSWSYDPFKLWDFLSNFGTVEDKHFKFDMQVDHDNCYEMDGKLAQRVHGQNHVAFNL